MSIRNVMRNAARIFVEMPSDPSPTTPPPANPPTPAVTPVYPNSIAAATVPLPGIKIDFEDIYRQSGVIEPPLNAEKICDMLLRLPPNLPQDTKRQMMREMLTTLGKPAGATIESIVADASAKISALTKHIDDSKTQTGVAAIQAEIAALQAQIAQKKQSLELSRREQAEVERQCGAECKRLSEVLNFFGPASSAKSTRI
jgi:hypothetical protein